MNALVLLFIATVWLRKISTLPRLYSELFVAKTRYFSKIMMRSHE